MKLATFQAPGCSPALGIVTANERVIDIRHHLPDAPSDMCTLIADWAVWQPALSHLMMGVGERAVHAILTT